MTYNLHPIFVHFPIALLLFYSLLRLFPWPKKWPHFNWQIPRIYLLVAGLLGAYLANLTGGVAEDITSHHHDLLEMHEFFAGFSVNIYVILLIAELIVLLKPEYLKKFSLHALKPILIYLQKIFNYKIIFILLTVIGVVSISVTGLLGGVMVHGLAADPLAIYVLKVLSLPLNVY
ncbi:MAG: hypothetical protein RBT30_03615 [Patescibacteria group bacterium]|jgi:uncharacterized membrane protein|nr:hypothetical protein [Patescibacteria group bacterium]